MKIECPYCRAEMEIQPDHLGKRADCPSCKAEMQIPVLTAKIIEPPQPKPVDRITIQKAVFWALIDFCMLWVALAVIFWIVALILQALVR